MRNLISPAIYKSEKNLIRLFRRAVTPQNCMLPGFLIIGAQRCGTTSLYKYLTAHPKVEPSLRKEIHYFDFNYDKPEKWYRSYFPRENKSDRKITGEATPYYIFHPHTAERIKKLLPDVKIIVMLRDPVKRAYSHYSHHAKFGVEKLTFEQAIEEEPNRLKGELDRILSDANYEGYNYQMYSYLERGKYYHQLVNWLRHFSTDQILIINSENFFKKTAQEYNRVLKFLGLPGYRRVKFKKHNVGKRSGLNQETKSKLKKYFKPHNQKLYTLLNTDFNW